MIGQSRRAIRVTQLINDHRRAKRFLQQGLCDPGVRVNTSRINRADAGAGDGCDGETPILTAGRKQLHRVADIDAEFLGQPGADDDRAGIISKIIEAARNQFVQKVRGLRVKNGINSKKIDRRIFESGARAELPAQDR